ncbi:MAG: Holliday junction branch migration protein RuvA [Proteobacteria bacterium]|nr:Holliday junction branch migration protein RuvA [Pseudomonadota bacterium]MCH8322122.1 Holliday junction branch migration protein RuvA [Pseudomonadota bacterium]
MIAKLKGLVDSIGEDSLIVDVGGVGYLVYASTRTLSHLPAVGEPVELLIETHVREDHIHLYGFPAEGELKMFRTLLGVQGVGVRVALAILTILDPDALLAALASGDKTAISQAAGVGPKLAARLINELKDKVGGFVDEGIAAPTAGAGSQEFQDALSALVQLGYKPSQAHPALLAARSKAGEGADVGALVKAGLKELSK